MRKLAAAALLLGAMPCFAAYDAFLKINTLKPASSDPSHPGWLRVSGFRWGANAPAGAPGCITHEVQFTVPSDISYFFQHSMGHHEMIPEATIEYMNARHLVTNLTVRDVRGTTVFLHFAECRTHPAPHGGVVPNTTTRPQPRVHVYELRHLQRFARSGRRRHRGPEVLEVQRASRLSAVNIRM